MKPVRNSGFRWTLLDTFVALGVVLAAGAGYLTFIRPLSFSGLIQREWVQRYAEIELVLSPDLEWMKEDLKPGTWKDLVYGNVDWKILESGEEDLGSRKGTVLRIQMMAAEESPGVLRYGNFRLLRGARLQLSNTRVIFEGRVRSAKILEDVNDF